MSILIIFMSHSKSISAFMSDHDNRALSIRQVLASKGLQSKIQQIKNKQNRQRT